jgi:hypothetical protein
MSAIVAITNEQEWNKNIKTVFIGSNIEIEAGILLLFSYDDALYAST